MDDKTRRKLSRSKKALSTALLVYCVTELGGKIWFQRSRTSHYALKVLRGIKVEMNGQIVNNEDFTCVYQKLVKPMKDIIEHNKIINKSHIIVTQQLIDVNKNQRVKIKMIPFHIKIHQEIEMHCFLIIFQ